MSERIVQTLPVDEAVLSRQRQEFYTFTISDAGPVVFETWLSEQPRDLTLGEQRWLPHEALPYTPATPAEQAKRAGLLLQHQSLKALLRVGTDGVVEREALWWAVAGGGIGSTLPDLEHAWKEVLGTDAWLQLLDAGDALVARMVTMSRAENTPIGVRQALMGMTCAAMGLTTKALASLTGTALTVNPNLEQMTPTSGARWDAPDSSGSTVLERCLRLATEGFQIDRTSLDTFAEAVFALLDWVEHNPTDADGQPRHGLLELCLTLFARCTSSAHLSVITGPELVEALQHGRFSPEHNHATRLAVLACAHHLLASGAQVSEKALGNMQQEACATQPSGLSLLAAAQQLRLERRMDEPVPTSFRRPRM